MKPTLYESVISSLESAKGKWPSVADGSGVSRRTIEKIARKEIPNPSVHLCQRLHDYFAKSNKKAA